MLCTKTNIHNKCCGCTKLFIECVDLFVLWRCVVCVFVLLCMYVYMSRLLCVCVCYIYKLADYVCVLLLHAYL